MLIDIKTVISSNCKDIVEYIKTLSVPAVLLDGSMKILSKNSNASAAVRGLRKGILIKKFVSPEDYLKLSEIKTGQSLYAEIIDGDMRYGATVIGGEDFCLAVLHPLDSGIRCSIGRMYDKMSGYDLHISISEPDEDLQKPFNKEISRFFRRKLEEICSVRELPFFNAAAVLRGLFSELNHFSPEIGSRFITAVQSEELIIAGSERDFALLAGILISYCTEIAAEDKCIFEAMALGNEAMLRVAVKSDISYYDILRFTENGAATEDAWFKLYLLRLLADGNLWEFRIGEDIEGRLAFTLRAPLTTPLDAHYLRDISTAMLREIISNLFINRKTAPDDNT